MPHLLEARNLSKSFAIEGGIFQRRRGVVAAVKNVSFEINEGETLGLVGESGSGKTTLGRLLCGLYSHDSGQLLWEGRPLEQFSARERALRVQMIFQDPSASLNPKLTVETFLGEPLRLHARQKKETVPQKTFVKKQIEDLLDRVGLPTDILLYYPHQFSGGQKQRLAMARALALQPRILVADEPVSALDLSIQAQILNLLADLKRDYGLTTIVISHDLAVVGYLADRLLVMKEGELLEQGETSQVLSNPKHPYTKTLLNAIPKFFR